MPSFKLIGMFAAILAFGLALLYAQRAGLAQGRAEGEAAVNAIIASHAGLVTKAATEARAEERAQADRQRAAELELARKDEAKALTRAANLATQLRTLRDAADADPELARCLALPLPDGLRREPATP